MISVSRFDGAHYKERNVDVAEIQICILEKKNDRFLCDRFFIGQLNYGEMLQIVLNL